MKRFSIILPLLFFAALSTPVFAGDGGEAATEALRKKLKSIRIPKLSFADTRVTTVFEFLKKRSRDLDPNGAGVNFMLILPRQKARAKSKDGAPVEIVVEPKVTIDMDNLPLEDAIRFVCTQAGLHYKIESHAVIVMDKSVTRQRLELRIFNIDPRVLKDVKDIKKFFEEKGVKFPTTGR